MDDKIELIEAEYGLKGFAIIINFWIPCDVRMRYSLKSRSEKMSLLIEARVRVIIIVIYILTEI